MKHFRLLMATMALAAATGSLTSCDDNPWHDDWHDPYGFYDNYDDYRWNDGNYNQGQQGSSDNELVSEANTLCGMWGGDMTYSYINTDGNSRSTETYYTEMEFYQYGQQSDATSGSGIETDYLYNDDGTVDKSQSQTLRFTWYVDTNGDIYVKYASGSTFVLDAGASQYGFFLGNDGTMLVDAFQGYMIGTGSVKGDVIYIDFERLNTTSDYKVASRAADAKTETFGSAQTFSPIAGAKAAAFNKRR